MNMTEKPRIKVVVMIKEIIGIVTPCHRTVRGELKHGFIFQCLVEMRIGRLYPKTVYKMKDIFWNDELKGSLYKGVHYDMELIDLMESKDNDDDFLIPTGENVY